MAWEYALAGFSRGLQPGLAQFSQGLATAPERNRDRYYTQGIGALTGLEGAATEKPEFSVFDPNSWGLSDAPDMPAAGEAIRPDGGIDYDRLSLYAIRRGRTQDAANFMKLGLAEEQRRIANKEREETAVYKDALKTMFKEKQGDLPDWGAASAVAAQHGKMEASGRFSELALKQQQVRRQLAQADRQLGQGDRRLDLAERELMLGEEKSFRAFRAQDKQETAMRLMSVFNPEDLDGSRQVIERLIRQESDLAAEMLGMTKEDMKHRKIVGIETRKAPNGREIWAPIVRNSKTGTTGPMTMQGGTGADEDVVAIDPLTLPRLLAPYVPKTKPREAKWTQSDDGNLLIDEKSGQTREVPKTQSGQRKVALDIVDEHLQGMDKNPILAESAPRIKATAGSVLESLQKRGIPAPAVASELVRVLSFKNEISTALVYEPMVEKQPAAMNALEQYLIDFYQGSGAPGSKKTAGGAAPAAAKTPARRTRPTAPASPAAPKPATPNYGWLDRLMQGGPGAGIDATGSMGEMPLDDIAAKVRRDTGLPPGPERLDALERAGRAYGGAR